LNQAYFQRVIAPGTIESSVLSAGYLPARYFKPVGRPGSLGSVEKGIGRHREECAGRGGDEAISILIAVQWAETANDRLGRKSKISAEEEGLYGKIQGTLSMVADDPLIDT